MRYRDCPLVFIYGQLERVACPAVVLITDRQWVSTGGPVRRQLGSRHPILIEILQVVARIQTVTRLAIEFHQFIRVWCFRLILISRISLLRFWVGKAAN